VKDWTEEERLNLRVDVAQNGLQSKFRDKSLQNIAKDILEISRAGLNSRNRLNAHGENETVFLQDLDRMALLGENNADRLIRQFKGAWDYDIMRTYKECIY
jgi:glutamate--cysteine ligase